MSRTFSNQMLAAMHAEASGEVFLPLVKLTQAAWLEAFLIAPNTESIVHAGEEYKPLAFAVGLPNEEAEGVPVLDWVADNVDRRLVEAMRQVKGAVAARIVWVLASTPDQVEIGPMEVEMWAAEYDALRISGTMGVEPILDQPFGHLKMDPANAPGLF